jgi:hypothetical protein
MVVVLPGCREFVDRGDRDFDFESAFDEGAYHSGPTLAIPPPLLGQADLDLPKSGANGLLGYTRLESRQPFGVCGRNASPLELSGQPMRPPTTALGSNFDKALSDP